MHRRALVVALLVGLTACAGEGDGGGPAAGTTPPVSVAPPRPPGLSAALPEPRSEIAGTAWSGRIAVAGGFTEDGRASRRFDIYDPAADAWTPGPELPMALHHAALVEGPKERLWLIGGYTLEQDDSWRPRSEVWSLGETDDEWKPEPPLTEARGALSATLVGRSIVAAGGTTRGDGRAESVSREVEFLEPGRRWTRAPDMFEPREHFALATVGDRVMAIGGRAGGLDTNLRSVESWKPGENTWRREGALQKERGGFAAAAINSTVCAAGGEQPNRTISLVECLRDGRWRVVAQLSQARHGLAVVGLAGRLHVIGGGPKPGLTVSEWHEVVDVGA